MKNFKTLILIIMLTSASTLLAQKITGDGNVVKETRSLPSFDKIESSGIVNIFLTQGDREFAVIESDKNLLALIETYVNDNTLFVKTKEDVSIKKSTKMNVYITLKNLSEINLSGVGNVESSGKLKINDLKIENSGVGNIKLNLDSKNLACELDGVGNVILTGNVTTVVISNNGVGNVKAFDLTADILNIQSNGVGNAEVNSDKEIYISLNGMGNVSYKGNAIVKELSKNGFGNVKKM